MQQPEENAPKNPLLPTARFRIRCNTRVPGCENTTFSAMIRGMCDTGAQVNLITYSCAVANGLEICPSDVRVHGIDDGRRVITQGVVRGEICSGLNHPTGIFAYFGFNIPGKIDAIIGAGTLAELADADVVPLKHGCVAMGTELGYIIFGRRPEQAPQDLLVGVVTNEDLDQAVQRLWQLQEYPQNAEWSAADRWCDAKRISTAHSIETEKADTLLQFRLTRKES